MTNTSPFASWSRPAAQACSQDAKGARSDPRALLQAFGGFSGECGADNAMACGGPSEIGCLQQCRLAGACEADDGGNRTIAGHMTNGVDLLGVEFEQPLRIFSFDACDALRNNFGADPGPATLGKCICGLRHGVLCSHDLARRVDRRRSNGLGLRITDLRSDGHEIRAGFHLGHHIGERDGVIDEPMHRFGDVALIERGTLGAEYGEHASRLRQDLSGGLGALGAT